MSYGRGCYGYQSLAPQQLAPPQLASRPRSSGSWFGALLLVGVGAAVWLAWPSRSKHDGSPPPEPTRGATLEQLARARGFSSLKSFEDAVVASARELRATGAHVDLGSHLAYLDPRVAG